MGFTLMDEAGFILLINQQGSDELCFFHMEGARDFVKDGIERSYSPRRMRRDRDVMSSDHLAKGTGDS